MKKILLTSTGFDNENIKNKFIELLDTEIKNVKVLFIITAANAPDAIRVLPFCLDDLTNCGISDENIIVYDMYKSLSQEEINKYNAIYVCGGSTDYLTERMNEINFKESINSYINNGGIYVGVSAGSIVASNCLSLLENNLDVHRDKGTNNGVINSNDDIYLTDNQCLYINDYEKIIFE